MKTNKKYTLSIIAAISLWAVSIVAFADCGCGGDWATNNCPCNESFYQSCDTGCASITDNCPCAAPAVRCEGCSYNETYGSPPLNNSCACCSGASCSNESTCCEGCTSCSTGSY